MKQLLTLFLFIGSLAWAQPTIIGEYQGNCAQGNSTVTTAATPSTSKVLGSFPACTVAVYITGSSPATLATLYTNATGSTKANPFTANADGSYQFFVGSPVVDIQMSGGGFASPFTLGSQTIPTPGVEVSDSLYINLTSLCTAAGSGTAVISKSWTNVSTRTLSCALRFAGGLIQSAYGSTITIGRFSCPVGQQCFDATTNISTVTAGVFVTGVSYTILTVGSTNFTTIGASSNTVGVTFTATGAGTGTGTATVAGIVFSAPQSSIDVTAFGATTSSSNNTPQYSAVMAACPSGGCVITVPVGTFIGHFLIPPYPSGVAIRGATEASSILIPDAINTPLFSLTGLVSNYSSAKNEIGSLGIKAHASGSTGASIDVSGMVHPYLHDLAWYSNGSGNFAIGILQDTTIDGRSFGIDAQRLTVDLQKGPITFAKTVQYGSINHWSNIWITSNTGMTTVFNFTATGTGGNTLDSWICEDNVSAVCLYPGNNLHERNGYYEYNAGYIVGNSGDNNTFTEDTFSGNQPGVGITGTNQESRWVFINDVWMNYGIPPTPASLNLYNVLICQGSICNNTNGQGGFLTSKVNTRSPYTTSVSSGGSLSSTSCNGFGICTYVMTAVDQAGNESSGVTLSPITVTGSGKIIQGQGNAENGVAFYKVYGPNCPTTCGYIRQAQAGGEEVGFVIDDGTMSPGTSPPTQDQTGSVISQNGLYVPTAPNMVQDTSTTPNSIVGTLQLSTGLGTAPYPAGFTVYIPAIANTISAGSYVSFTLNGTTLQVNGSSNSPGTNFQCTVVAGSPLMLTWNGSTAWISPNCGANSTVAYAPYGYEQGANNALVVASPAIPLVAGQAVQIYTSHTCGSGCTIKWNGVVYNLKSGFSPGNNITTTYSVGSIITAIFDGVRFQDSRQ